MLSRVALENYFSSVDENESYFPTYSQAFAYERYLQEEFSKVLLSNIFAAFLFLSSLPFPSIPQCLFFRPIFTPLDGPNSHLLLLTRKIVNSWREKGMFLDPRTTRKRVYLCPQLTTRYPPQYRQSSLTRESYIERYLLTLFFFDIIPQYETILHQHRVIFLRRTVTLRF